MPILQWMLKANPALSRSKREQCTIEEEEGEAQVKSIFNSRGSDEGDHDVQAKSSTFTILLRRDDSRACFYSTLQLQRRNSLNYERQQYIWRSEGGGLVGMGSHKAESVAVGCKVLTMGSSGADHSNVEVQKRRRGTVSPMKDLLRWAAAAKFSKGGIRGWKVMYFQNKSSLKDPLEDTSSSSSKISVRWDVGSCSTSSSVYSPPSLALASRSDRMWTKNPSSTPSINLQSSNSKVSSLCSPKTEGCNRAGQWITSDSDFLVLEL